MVEIAAFPQDIALTKTGVISRGGSGWTVILNGAQQKECHFEQRLSLDGWTKKGLAFMPMGFTLQEPEPLAGETAGNAHRFCRQFDFFTTKRMSSDDLAAMMNLVVPTPMGFNSSLDSATYGEYNQLILGRSRTWVEDASITQVSDGFMRLIHDQSMGSNQPIAASDVWYYRCITILIGAEASNFLDVPCARASLVGELIDMGDLPTIQQIASNKGASVMG